MPYKTLTQQKAWYQANKAHHKATCDRHRRRHARLIDAYKQFVGCERCGWKESPKALQFHHLRPEEKLFTIGKKIANALDKVILETFKCQVLCANCHAITESEK